MNLFINTIYTVLAALFGAISGYTSHFLSTYLLLGSPFYLTSGLIFGITTVLYFYVFFSKNNTLFPDKRGQHFNFWQSVLFILGSTLIYIIAFLHASLIMFSDQEGILNISLTLFIGGAAALVVYELFRQTIVHFRLKFSFIIFFLGAVPAAVFYIPNALVSFDMAQLTLLVLWQANMLAVMSYYYQKK